MLPGSFGMNITSERLELVSRKYNIITSVIISDLHDNGAPDRTEVTTRIPM